MSFGRKGLVEGGNGAGAIPARRASPPAGMGNSAVDNFIQAERQRAAELGISRPHYHEAPDGRRPDPSQLEGYRAPGPRKSMLLAYVLWWFGYAFSAHRFYLGDTAGAVKQCGLFLGSLVVMIAGGMSESTPVVVIGTIGLCIAFGWFMVDMFRIPGMCRRANAGPDLPNRYFE